MLVKLVQESLLIHILGKCILKFEKDDVMSQSEITTLDSLSSLRVSKAITEIYYAEFFLFWVSSV